MIVTLVMRAFFVLCLIGTLVMHAFFVLCSIVTLVMRAFFVLSLIVMLVMCVFFVLFFIVSNDNRTEWSPIRSVIIRVITKLDDRAAGV